MIEHYFRSLCQDVSDAMEFNTTIRERRTALCTTATVIT